MAMTPPDKPEEEDSRTFVRKKTLRTGVVVFNQRKTTVECAISDLSDMGARLRPTGAAILPDEFELQVLYGGTFQCRVIHRTRDQVGVRFI